MAPKCQYSKVVIPGDPGYAEIAGNFVGSVAKRLGFAEKDSNNIKACTEKAIAWAIDYSLANDEKISVEIRCELVLHGFKVSIRDQGIPFDPAFSTEKNSAKPIRGLPIEGDVDEVIFNNLGPAGKEIVLLKYTYRQPVWDHFDACELEFSQAPSEAIPSKETNCRVKAMESAEAIEVSKCIYKGYGYSYSYEHMYYPEKLVEMNQKKRIFSVIAVSDDDDVAGHCALLYENSHDQIAEMGLGVVKPEYRSQGCFDKMTERLIQKAIADRLAGIFVQAVTLHRYSQKTAARYDLNVCALLLAYIPTTVDFRRMNKSRQQRMTVFLCFRYLKNGASKVIYPPQKHSAIIGELYDNLGIAPLARQLLSTKDKTYRSEAVLQIKVVKSLRFAQIVCEAYGHTIVREVKQRLRELCLRNIEVICLYLDISDPHTGTLSESLEPLGFFFAGILPCAMPNGSDALIYQYLNNIEVEFEKIEAHTKMAKKLVTYVKSQYTVMRSL